MNNEEILKQILTKVENIENFLMTPGKVEIDIKTNNSSKKPKKAIIGMNRLESKKQSKDRKLSLSSKLNRSQYPEIHNIKNLLPLALLILKEMKNKGIECLTPPEISFILKEVFNITKKSERISVALNQKGSLKYTDRKRFFIGKTLAYNYSISEEGGEYLENKLKKKIKNG